VSARGAFDVIVCAGRTFSIDKDAGDSLLDFEGNALGIRHIL